MAILNLSYFFPQLCEMKTQAILASVSHLMPSGVDLEGIIRPIMQAEAKVYTARREKTVRTALWDKVYPPLEVHKRELGTRKDGTKGYAYDVKLEDVTHAPYHMRCGAVRCGAVRCGAC